MYILQFIISLCGFPFIFSKLPKLPAITDIGCGMADRVENISLVIVAEKPATLDRKIFRNGLKAISIRSHRQ
jgi:hypothetical protein